MNRASQLMAFVLGGAMAFALLQMLSACSEGRMSVDNVVRVFGSMTAIDPAGEKELERFYDVYDTYSNNSTNLRQRDHFRDAFRHVRAHYVVKMDDAKLISAAIKGVEDKHYNPGSVAPQELVETGLDAMMAELDPHSSYLNPEELLETRVVTRGEFGGLGIEVSMEDGKVKVVSPIEDTPAFHAGIQAGDYITGLDGKPLGDMTLSQAVKLMRGRPGEAIVLTIEREGMAPFDVRVVRAIIKLRSVRWRLEGDIGYIRLVSFTEKVEPMLEQAVDELMAQSDGAMRGVVLDLRNNPGGLLDQSLFVSDSFLDDGIIVSIRERDPGSNRVFKAEQGDLFRGLPMVVLINEGSASASEIVASALKDHGRALVMGRRSFGKGSVQTIQPLPLEGGLRLTTALYYAPSGRTIQARGVGPDIILTRPMPKDADAVPVLQREADLPHAFDAESAEEKPPVATLDREKCPKAGPEDKDMELGCALAYLHAGSTPAFLAGLPKKMSSISAY